MIAFEFFLDSPKSTIYYFLYKCFLVLFLFTHQITHFWYKIVKKKQGGKYYLYLTRQGFTLLLVALFLDACLVLLRYFEEQKNKNDSENQGMYRNMVENDIIFLKYFFFANFIIKQDQRFFGRNLRQS